MSGLMLSNALGDQPQRYGIGAIDLGAYRGESAGPLKFWGCTGGNAMKHSLSVHLLPAARRCRAQHLLVTYLAHGHR